MQFAHRDGLNFQQPLSNMFLKFRSTFHMQRTAVPVALVPILLIRSVLGGFVKVESRQIAFVQGVRSTLAPLCDYRWALHTWLVKWHLAWAWRAHASHSPSCIFQAQMKALMEGGVPWPSPVGGFAFESCPPRKVSARFDVIPGAAALLFVSSALPPALLNGGERNQGSVTSQRNVGLPSWILLSQGCARSGFSTIRWRLC